MADSERSAEGLASKVEQDTEATDTSPTAQTAARLPLEAAESAPGADDQISASVGSDNDGEPEGTEYDAEPGDNDEDLASNEAASIMLALNWQPRGDPTSTRPTAIAKPKDKPKITTPETNQLKQTKRPQRSLDDAQIGR